MTDDGAYIRGYYRAPANVGGRIRFHGYWGHPPREGTILPGSTMHLRVHLDGDPAGRYVWMHPTWEIEYLPDGPVFRSPNRPTPRQCQTSPAL